ncbi:MAG: zinc-ribbon domain-containing protein [Candidatus Auribacterota bacterium]|nr:zinc-ribbon domain-containing protein [Candidatus Auribacterota bacterium]
MSKIVRCPKCGSEVPEDNLRCFFCGSMLDISVGPLSFIANKKGGLVISIIAIITILFLLKWFF